MTGQLNQFRTILITGATGFVGTALTRTLLRQGHPGLRCLARDAARAEQAGIPAACCVAGDVTIPASLREAVAGVDLVVHLAGTLKGNRAADYEAVNVGGTRVVLAVLRELAPGARFVLVSSLAAAGPGADGHSSLLPPAAARPVSAYGESKRQGELAVTGTPGLDFAIVRPPVIYGAGDGATRLLFRQAMAPVTFVPPRSTPLSVAHVDDVVRAILCAAGAAPRGAILPVDGPERTDTHAFVRAIAAAAGRRARLVPMPLAIAAGAANLLDLGCRLFGRSSYFNRDKVRELAVPGWVADGGPLRRLGCVPQVALAAGLREVALAERLVAATSAGA